MYGNWAYLNTIIAISSCAVAISGVCSLLLLKRPNWHATLMQWASALFFLFLLSFSGFHASQWFSGTENAVVSAMNRPQPPTGLASLVVLHAMMASITIPMVLVTLYFAKRREISKHRSLAPWTLLSWILLGASGWGLFSWLWR